MSFGNGCTHFWLSQFWSWGFPGISRVQASDVAKPECTVQPPTLSDYPAPGVGSAQAEKPYSREVVGSYLLPET